MPSLPEFLLIAVLVTVTPGPGTATIVRVAPRDGRRGAMSAALGNSGGVLVWGLLSALAVSSLIIASQVAYDVATFVVAFGLCVALFAALDSKAIYLVGPGVVVAVGAFAAYKRAVENRPRSPNA